MLNRIARTFLPPLLCLLSAGAAMAQLPTATLLGTIKDPQGALVAGAKVTARNTDTNEARTVIAAADGSYRFSALPVGNYEVRVEENGFKSTVRGGLILNVGQEQSLDLSLELGAATEQVNVSADVAPLTNTTSSSLGGTVSEQKMTELPLNGRDYIQLALLQAGTTEDRSRTPSSNALAGAGTWFSSNGAPVRANAYLLDGTSLATYGGGSGASISGNTLGLDGIREFRIVTNSFDAEYGMVMGSQMAMVSKSGTNAFHGTAFEYLRNNAMDARNYFDTAQSAGLSVGGTQRRLPPFRRNNFGGSVGGPIQKNKTFFHLAYEGLRQLQSLTYLNQTLPAGCRGAAGATITGATCPQLGSASSSVKVDPRVAPWLNLYPLPNNGVSGLSWSFAQPNTEDYGQGRVDHTFSDKDSVFGRFTIDNDDLMIPGLYPGSPYLSSSRNQYVTAAENHVINASMLNTARFSFSSTQQLIGVLTYVTGPQYSYEAGIPMGTLGVGGLTQAQFGGNPTSQAQQNVFSYSDDLFITKGRHSIKTGFLINHYQTYVANGVSLWGQIKFASISTFLQGVPTNYQAIAPGGINYKDVRYDTTGGYVQDDYKFNQRLTLNLGFRYEINTDPRVVGPSAPYNGALIDPINDVNLTHTTLLTRNPSFNNIGPHLGFAFDVFGNGKTAVRGGFGELYQIAGWMSFLHGSTRAPFGQNQFTGNSANWSLPFPVPTGNSLATLQARNPTLYDWNIKQPKMLQYNLTVQQQLPWQMALSVAYAGSRGYNLQTLTDGNPVVPNGVPGTLSNGALGCVYAGSSNLPPINQQNLVFGPTANACVAPVVTAAQATPVYPVQPNVAARQNNYFGPGNEIKDSATSWYNSLQVEVQKAITRGVQFQSNVTFSRLLDTPQGSSSGVTESVGSSTYASDPWNPGLDRGPALFNTPVVWKSNIIYHLPKFNASNRFVGGLINGWWMTGIAQVQTGYPFTVTFSGGRSGLNVDGSNVAVVDRPMVNVGRRPSNITQGSSTGCTGVATGTRLGTPGLWFDPCAFSIQSAGFLGNESRNFLTGPHYRDVDYSLVKDTRAGFLGEAGSIEIRAEIFNILNHANFGLPNSSVFAGTGAQTNDVEAVVNGAGQITSALPSRQVQLSMKVLF